MAADYTGQERSMLIRDQPPSLNAKRLREPEEKIDVRNSSTREIFFQLKAGLKRSSPPKYSVV